MRWLLHGQLTPAVADALRGRGDAVQDPAAVGVTPESPHADVLKAAHKAQVDVLTSDARLSTTYRRGVPTSCYPRRLPTATRQRA